MKTAHLIQIAQVSRVTSPVRSPSGKTGRKVLEQRVVSRFSPNVQVSQEVVKRRTVAGHVAVVSTSAGFLVVVEAGQQEDEL